MDGILDLPIFRYIGQNALWPSRYSHKSILTPVRFNAYSSDVSNFDQVCIVLLSAMTANYPYQITDLYT